MRCRLRLSLRILPRQCSRRRSSATRAGCSNRRRRASSSTRCCARTSGTRTRSSTASHPPRVLKPEAFPKLDAVVLTPRARRSLRHSVAGEARSRDSDLPVGAIVDAPRARSSREMGFQVHPLVPGRAVQFGDLELTPFRGDHVERRLRRRVGHAALLRSRHRRRRQLLLDGRHHDDRAATSTGRARAIRARCSSAGRTTRSTGATWPTTWPSASRRRRTAS